MVDAHLITYWRVKGATAVASVVADLLLQTIAQGLFALLGALLLARLIGVSVVLPGVLAAGTLTILALGGFYVVQRHVGARLIDRAFVALSRRLASRGSASELGMQQAVEAVWQNRSQLLIAVLVHTLAWTVGTLEVWFGLKFMGWPVTLDQAIIIESLGAGISSAAFFVPGSWGIQEGGYILIGHLLGLPMPLALALSLVKRVPDFALGLPGLLAWHALEGRRLFFGQFIEVTKNKGEELIRSDPVKET
jgi:putative membrane protein